MKRAVERGHVHAPEQHAYRIPYHWCMSPFHRYVAERAVARVSGALEGATVLEMGCGDGFATALIARHARRVHGFDISERAVAFARMIVEDPNVSFEVADAHDVSGVARRFGESVDVVAAFEVVEHLAADELRSFLRSSFEILAPAEGRMVLTTPNGGRTRSGGNPHHAQEFSVEDLTSILREAGFQQVRISGLYLQPPWKRLEHFANTAPFSAIFQALARAGRRHPRWCRTLVCIAQTK